MKFEKPDLSQKKLSDVIAIQKNRGEAIGQREKLRGLVEPPLLSACEELYDKNIQTYSSSANKKDIEIGEGYIMICFDSLSEENKNYARKLGEPFTMDGQTMLRIAIPLKQNDSVLDIENHSLEIVHGFKKQPATWVESFSLEDLRELIGLERDDPSGTPEVVTQGMNLYFDSHEGRWYGSEELWKKAHEKL
ncbi:MAG TPA: hypothetical protein VFQ60_00560 [Patescibacteria group bacterium]|nr:hypothetical protein [Patescibacteria group bacterium]